MYNCKLKYSKEHFPVVLKLMQVDAKYHRNGEFLKEQIYELFEEQDAEKLIAAISTESGPKFGPDFSIKADPLPVKTNNYNEDNADWDNDNENSVLSNFNKPDTGGRVAYDNMLNSFRKRLIKDLIYNLETGKRVNQNDYTESGYSIVGEALYNFKQELLQTIWAFTGISREEEFSDYMQFTKQINTSLADFKLTRINKISLDGTENKSFDSYLVTITDSNGKPIQRNAYLAYVMLSNFNKILIDNCGDIVKIKPEYKDSRYHDIEMYDYFGPHAVQDYSPSNNEDADVSKYSSDLVKILCDYIPEVSTDNKDSEVAIGFTGFCRVMSLMKAFAEDPSREAYKKLYAKSIVNGNIVNSGAEIDWYSIINEYLNSIKNIKSEFYTTLTGKLRGIQKYIFTKLDATGKPEGGLPLDFRHVFAAQADRTVSCNYTSYRWGDPEETDEVEKLASLSGRDLMDDYVQNQTFFIQEAAQQSAKFFRDNPNEFKKFLDTHNISFRSSNGRRTFNINGDAAIIEATGTQKAISITNSRMKSLEDNYIRTLIEDLLHIIVPDDYKNILTAINQETLADTFSHVIGYTLDASIDTETSIYTYKANKNKTERSKNKVKMVPNMRPYNFYFNPAAKFLALVYGEETMTTLKNGEGNNLPLFQLGALVNDLRSVIEDLSSGGGLKSSLTGRIKTSVFANSFIVKNKNSLGKVWIRSDIKNGTTTKQAKALNVAEVSYLSIFKDYYEGLVTNGEVKIQPITFADKARHFLFSFKTASAKIKADGHEYILKNVLTTIANTFKYKKDGSINEDHKEAVSKMVKGIKDTRRQRTRRQVINLISRYKLALNIDNWQSLTLENLNKEISKLYNSSDNELVEAFDKVRSEVKKYSSSEIENLFKEACIKDDKGNNESRVVDFYPEADISISKEGDSLDLNELICQDVDLYLKTGNLFERRIKREQFNFANDLHSAGMRINKYLDNSLSKIIKSWESESDVSKWVDNISGEIKFARFYKWNGDNKEEIIPTAVDWKVICSPLNPEIDNYEIELNPILESYYYGDILISNELDIILFGTTSAYPSKVKGRFTTDDDFYRISEANRFVTQTKRTVPAGATRYRFYTNMPHSISANIKVAVMSDICAPLWNMTGHYESDKTTDGCGFTSAIQAILENWSLLDAAVGNDKKTIFMGYDPETGMPKELKWAEFDLSNMRRKCSPVSEDMSVEEMFRKMHSFAFNKGTKIRLQDYYDPSASRIINSKYDKDRHLTTTKTLYKYVEDDNGPFKGGSYYKLNKISSNALDNTYVAHWQEVTPTGIDVATDEIIFSGYLNNLYDVDQAFGGAYTMEYDPKINRLVDSTENNYICARLVCEENLKDKFHAYVVNRSAIKVGACNVNPSNVFAPGNEDLELSYFEMSSIYGGVQMDAEHHVEGGTVTEMSQLISALIQNGYSYDIVNEIYTDIGRVTKQAIDKLIAATENERNSGNNDEVYKILGKALIKSFSNGQKDTMGLAQAFVSLAETKLEKTKYKLPFSASTIKPTFISAVTSTLNASSIKRKYSGLAGVQSPSYGIMQYFAPDGDDNQDYYTYQEMANVIRHDPKWKAVISDPNIYFNPQLQGIHVYNLKFDSSKEESDDNPKYIVSNIRRAFFDQMLDKNTGEIKNPYIKRIRSLIDLKSLDIEDTIVVRKIGDTGLGNVIRLNSIFNFDFYRNCIDLNEYEIYRWTIKPRDLKQSETWLTVKDGNKTKRLNLYDLDTIRAAFYLADEIERVDVWEKDHLVNENAAKYWNMYLQSKELRYSLLNKVLHSEYPLWIDILTAAKAGDKNAQQELKKIQYDLNVKTQDLMEELDKVQEGGTLEIDFQESLDGKVSSDLNLSRVIELKNLFASGNPQMDTNRFLREAAFRRTSANNDIVDLDSRRTEENNLEITEEINSINSAFNDLESAIDHAFSQTDGETVVISRPDTSKITVTKVDFRASQIIAGRVYAEQLGLNYGDSIHVIKSKKEAFFKEKLNNVFSLPASSVNSNDYDAVLYTPKGDKVLVAIESLDPGINTVERSSNYNNLSSNKKFKLFDGNYYYEGNELCSSDGLNFYSYIDDTGADWNLVTVSSPEALNALINTAAFSNIRWNYTKYNFLNNLRFKYSDLIGDDGNLIPGEKIRIRGREITNFNTLKEKDIIDYVNSANESEQYNTNKRLDNLAKNQYEAFKQSLKFVATRIPAQSMQSFTATNIVMFAETHSNDVYLPRVIAWLEGSDYDIDKWYAMGFSLLNNGILASLSNLYNRSSISQEELRALPYPKGIKFTDKPNKNNPAIAELYEHNYTINILVNNITGLGGKYWDIQTTFHGVDAVEALTFDASSLNVEEIPDGQFILSDFSYSLEDKTYTWRGVNSNGDFVSFNTDYSISPSLTEGIANFEGATEDNIITREELNELISNEGDINYIAFGNLLNRLYTSIEQNPNASKNIFFESSKLNIGEELTDAEILATLLIGEEVFDSFEKKKLLLDTLNLHSGTNLNNLRKIGALRNSVTNGIIKVISRPSSQINLHTQISFGDAKEAAKASTIGKRETYLNLDCPTAKFIMQEQNMIGRDVIGISAVSLKGFFAATDFFNMMAMDIKDIIESLNEDASQYKFDAIFVELKNILFDVNFGDSHLGSLANIYFKPLIKLLESPEFEQFKTIQISNTEYDPRIQSHLEKYIDTTNNTFNLYDCLVDVNYTMNYGVNGADSISALLSAATDNAKELILAKINATAKFADVYTYLLSIGVSFKEIAEFMISPIFNIISKYSSDNILDPSTNFFNLEGAIDFITNEKTLGNLNNDVFNWFISRWTPVGNLTNIGRKTNQGSVINNLLFDTDHNGNLNISKANNFTEVKTNSPLYTLLVDFKAHLENKIEVNVEDASIIIPFLDNIYAAPLIKSQFIIALKNLINGYYTNWGSGELTKVSEEDFIFIKEALLKAARFTYSNASESKIISASELEGEGGDYFDALFEDNYSVGRYNKYKELIDHNSMDIQTAIKIYSYIQNYFIPKAEQIYELDDYGKDLEKLTILKNYVLKGAEELSILGKFLGVNKGITTKDYEEYNWISSLEKFINKSYIGHKKKMIPFNFVKFMQDETYQKIQIDQYNQVKVTFPVLDIISKVPHFKEMLSVAGLNRELIQHSIAVKLERILARDILLRNQKLDSESGLNMGYKNSLNSEEFKAVSNYVNSILIHNWLIHQTGLTILAPVGFKEYVHQQGRVGALKVPKFIHLNSETGAANFKALVEEFLLPSLQRSAQYKDEPFIKQLSVGTNIQNKTGIAKDYLRSTIPMSKINCQKLQLKFDDIMASFNKIAKNSLSSLGDGWEQYKSWTIGDIFYLYNLLVYKDGYNKDALTRLFEDFAKNSDPASIIGSFYEYLSRLDHGDINIFEETSKNYNGYNYTEEKISTDKFEYNIKDALVYLAMASNSSYKFKAEISFDKIEGEGSFTLFTDSNEAHFNTIEAIKTSDYPLFLPYLIGNIYEENSAINSAEKLGIPTVSLQYTSLANVTKDVYEIIIDKIQELVGDNVKINIFDNRLLGNSYTGPMEISDPSLNEPLIINSESVWNWYNRAKGFIHKGEIFISLNKSNASEVALHEIMHGICAAMKFNKNVNIRHFYYNLLRSDIDPENSLMDEELRNKYIEMLNDSEYNLYLEQNSNIKTAEFKEEILVRLLASTLDQEIKTKFEENSKEAFKRTELRRKIYDVIDSIFTFDNPNLDYSSISSLSLKELVSVFSTNLINKSGGALTSYSIQLNQSLKDVKKRLIKDGEIKFTGDC